MTERATAQESVRPLRRTPNTFTRLQHSTVLYCIIE